MVFPVEIGGVLYYGATAPERGVRREDTHCRLPLFGRQCTYFPGTRNRRQNAVCHEVFYVSRRNRRILVLRLARPLHRLRR